MRKEKLYIGSIEQLREHFTTLLNTTHNAPANRRVEQLHFNFEYQLQAILLKGGINFGMVFMLKNMPGRYIVSKFWVMINPNEFEGRLHVSDIYIGNPDELIDFISDDGSASRNDICHQVRIIENELYGFGVVNIFSDTDLFIKNYYILCMTHPPLGAN
jgi:hypothetical protein